MCVCLCVSNAMWLFFSVTRKKAPTPEIYTVNTQRTLHAVKKINFHIAIAGGRGGNRRGRGRGRFSVFEFQDESETAGDVVGGDGAVDGQSGSAASLQRNSSNSNSNSNGHQREHQQQQLPAQQPRLSPGHSHSHSHSHSQSNIHSLPQQQQQHQRRRLSSTSAQMMAFDLQPLDCAHNQRLLNNVRPPLWINPAPQGRYNLIAIGAGAAGLISASSCSAIGGRAAIIEQKLFGGECLNFGCIPSKVLMKCAKVIENAVHHGREYGLNVINHKVDFPAIMRRMRRIRCVCVRVWVLLCLPFVFLCNRTFSICFPVAFVIAIAVHFIF